QAAYPGHRVVDVAQPDHSFRRGGLGLLGLANHECSLGQFGAITPIATRVPPHRVRALAGIGYSYFSPILLLLAFLHLTVPLFGFSGLSQIGCLMSTKRPRAPRQGGPSTSAPPAPPPMTRGGPFLCHESYCESMSHIGFRCVKPGK